MIMIRKRGSSFAVLSEKKDAQGRRKKLGTYPTKAKARERLRQVEAAKAAKGKP